MNGMKKQLIILGIGMLPWIATHAQQQDTTLIRTVVVEMNTIRP